MRGSRLFGDWSMGGVTRWVADQWGGAGAMFVSSPGRPARKRVAAAKESDGPGRHVDDAGDAGRTPVAGRVLHATRRARLSAEKKIEKKNKKFASILFVCVSVKLSSE